MPLHDRLLISFSGGRTSAYMANVLMRDPRWSTKVIVFANTGQEHDETLRFVERCDREWSLGVVWIEAVVNPARGPGCGTTHRIVDFATAARAGEPYEHVIAKYGIPHSNAPHCTRELKERPIAAYAKSIGWAPGTFNMAIGIRADEVDRVSVAALDAGTVYPLVDLGVTKGFINEWWSRQPFNLGIPEHFGNCVWCWKKSMRKLLTVAREAPAAFDFPRRMELEHAHTGSLAAKTGSAQRFFREQRNAERIVAEAQGSFEPYSDALFEARAQRGELSELDVGSACGESCEVNADQFSLVLE